jgi:NADH-quinone oxidoreductase subunit L
MGISTSLVYLIGLPFAGAAILLLGGRRTDKWGHL